MEGEHHPSHRLNNNVNGWVVWLSGSLSTSGSVTNGADRVNSKTYHKIDTDTINTISIIKNLFVCSWKC